MSKQVSLDEIKAQRSTRGEEVGWERWCDGQGHLLTRGEDFSSDDRVDSKRSAFLQWAKRHGFVNPSDDFRGPPTRLVGSDAFWLQVPAETHRLSDAHIACAQELQRLHAKKAPMTQIMRIRRAFRAGMHPSELPPIPKPKAKPKPAPIGNPVADREKRIAKELRSGVTPSEAVHTRRGRRL